MTENSYHHENLKQKLVDAGTRLILEEGIESLSLRRLAAECGVSHTAPYKHFKKKEAIIAAIMDQAERSFTRELEAAAAAMSGKPPKEKLVRLGISYVRFMVENPDCFRLLFFSDTRTLHPEIDLRQAPPPETSLGVFYRTALEYLESIGADARNRPTDILAMWAMVHGLAVMLVNRTLQPTRREDYQDLVQTILANNLVFPPEHE